MAIEPNEEGGTSMGFGEAISTCFRKYVDFNGRAVRSEYWFFALFQFLVLVALSIVDAVVGTGVLSTLGTLALLLPALAVGARRLHDTDKSAWWLLIGLIPLVGAIVLIVFFVQPGTPGANRFG
jgi:uncharacterized membrane protein YhaH (DUF805 family)